jgi:hypothetical protein
MAPGMTPVAASVTISSTFRRKVSICASQNSPFGMAVAGQGAAICRILRITACFTMRDYLFSKVKHHILFLDKSYFLLFSVFLNGIYSMEIIN